MPAMADPSERDLHIDLDLHVQGDGLQGRAASDGEPERVFSGWLELLAALDALVGPSTGEA
jgi:hypothetical protein